MYGNFVTYIGHFIRLLCYKMFALIGHISDPNSGIVKEYLFATNNL